MPINFQCKKSKMIWLMGFLWWLICAISGYQYTFNIENATTRMYKNEKIEPTMINQRIKIAHCDVKKHKKTSTIID